MTKKNKRFLAAALAVLMLLLACCGRNQDEKPADSDSVQETPVQYTVELCSDSGYPLEGIGIYVYTDVTMQELVWFARTDAEGKITFRDVTSEGYIAVLDGVSSDYIVEEYYFLEGEHTIITVVAQMQSDVDLSSVTRELGDVMFDFTVTDCDGVEYTLLQLLEEKDAVVLNFWYLNCSPCRMEFPYLQEAYEEYSDRIEVIAMNPLDGTDEKIAAFKEEVGLTFPMAVCDAQWEKAMQLTAYPTTVIIDRYGVISLIHTGSITSTKVFTDAFAHFTAEDYVQGIIENIEDLETEAPGANPNEPIELGGVESFEAMVPAGGKIYYNIYRVDGYLNIKNDDIYAVYKGTTYGPKAGGFGFSIKSPDTYTPAVLTLGNSGTEDQTFTVTISKPKGVVDNPYSVKLDKEFTTKVSAGNDQGVYYQVTAPKSGYLVFECLESPEKVTQFDYVMQNLSTNAQRTISEDGNEEGTMVSIPVKSGQKVKCWIVAEKDKNGNKYPGGTFKSKLYISDTPVREETEQVEKIDYAVTVTDGDRKPIKGVYLTVITGENNKTTIVTADTGVAHTRLEPGNYPVIMELPDGYTALTTEFTLSEDRPFVSVKLDAVKVETVTYTVTVVNEDNEPLSGISVMIGSRVETTGADGKASFDLPRGKYTVTVSRADGSVQNQTFAEGETEMTIVLSQGGTEPEPEHKITYSVKVVDFAGNAQSGVTVQFLKDGNPVAVQTTAGDGSVSAELTGGDYTVSLAFSGKQMYYEQTSAVLSANRPSLVLRATDTVASNPEKDWFGTVYKVDMGGTYVKMQPNVVTYFAFTPAKEGLYRITSSNPKSQLDFYGSINFPNKQQIDGATETSFEMNVKEDNLGGTYAIGITGASSTILIIERIGSAILDDTDVPWEIYQGNRPTKVYSAGGKKQFTMMDLSQSTTDVKLVKDDDGFYHLDSANGKMLYVNLGPDAEPISLYDMLGCSGVGGTKFSKYFYNDDGTLLKKEDYTECMIAYIEHRDPVNNVYPLNDDLMYMLQNGGEYKGWWDEASPNFILGDLNGNFNPEIAWMFLVCYVK